ncbi:MAG: D-amino acid dehydrogenase [Alphaproteobacteria bacterium]
MKVLVLGAGVVGATAAYYLNRAGHEVTVIDRQGAAGMETSFANGGHVAAFTSHPWASPSVPRMLIKWFGREDAPYLMRLRPDLRQWFWGIRFLRNCTTARHNRTARHMLRLSTYSYEALKAVREAEGIAYDQRAKGVLHLFRTQRALDEAAHAEALIDDPRARGEVMDVARAVALEPALEQSRQLYAGAVYSAATETGDAHKFTQAIAAAAAKHGADFRYGVTVRVLVREGSRITAVETDKGRFSADAVVLSLGAEGALLLRKVGVDVPIYPVKGYSVTLPTAGYNGTPSLGIHDEERRIVTSTYDGRFRAAGTAELVGYDRTITRSRADTVLSAIMEMFPNGGDAARAERWTGLRPMTPDCAPLLGRTKLDNLYLDTGHGSLGWTLACGSGRVIADLVSGKRPEIDLTGFEVDRF